MSLQAKKYYSINGGKVSSNDFRLIQVFSNIKDRQIILGLRNYISRGDITITHRNEYGNVYFHVNDDDSIHNIKQLWSVIIGHTHNIRLVPAHFTDQDLTERNKWVAKFLNFNNSISAADVSTILQIVHAKNVYVNQNNSSIFFHRICLKIKACFANIKTGNRII